MQDQPPAQVVQTPAPPAPAKKAAQSSTLKTALTFSRDVDEHRHNRRLFHDAVPGRRYQGMPGYIGDGSRIIQFVYLSFLYGYI